MDKQEEAFTLLELMVVVAIVALTATMAFPSFEDYRERAKLKRAGRDLYSCFQMVRINALRDGKTWAIQFDSEGYWVYDDPGSDGRWITHDDNSIVKRVLISEYGGNVEFGSACGKRPGASVDPDGGISYQWNRVVFNSDGTGSRSGTVYLRNAQNDTFAVGAIASTGRIKCWAHWGDKWVH